MMLRQCYAEHHRPDGAKWRCVLELGHRPAYGAAGTDGAPFLYADGHRYEPVDEPTPEPKPKPPTVEDILDEFTPDHAWVHPTDVGRAWEWTTPQGMWKIAYIPNILGKLFNIGGPVVEATGPGFSLSIAADDTGLGILGANLRILGVIPNDQTEAGDGRL